MYYNGSLVNECVLLNLSLYCSFNVMYVFIIITNKQFVDFYFQTLINKFNEKFSKPHYLPSHSEACLQTDFAHLVAHGGPRPGKANLLKSLLKHLKDIFYLNNLIPIGNIATKSKKHAWVILGMGSKVANSLNYWLLYSLGPGS